MITTSDLFVFIFFVYLFYPHSFAHRAILLFEDHDVKSCKSYFSGIKTSSYAFTFRYICNFKMLCVNVLENKKVSVLTVYVRLMIWNNFQ